MTEEDRRHLLALARRALEAAVRGAPPPASSSPPAAALGVPAGAFVTLRHAGELRGCIGHLTADRALADTVSRMAVCAALEDPRFPPVGAAEIAELEIEISVVSPPVRLLAPDPARIRLGRDGVIVRNGACQGVLLPQVAVEYGWEAEAFLRATCRKAGLAADAWRWPQTELFVFEVEVFAEPPNPDAKREE